MPSDETEVGKGRSGPIAKPRPAATIILLRGGAGALEVLLVQRTPDARFMGGAWVFPGGSLDPQDGELGPQAFARAARRELREEAGVTLPDDHELIHWARWVTPTDSPIRFDTWFFLAAAPVDEEPTVDGAEIVDYRWIAPPDALAANKRDELLLMFPTRKQLEQLSGFASADALIAGARGREVVTVLPEVMRGERVARIVLPDDPRING